MGACKKTVQILVWTLLLVLSALFLFACNGASSSVSDLTSLTEITSDPSAVGSENSDASKQTTTEETPSSASAVGDPADQAPDAESSSTGQSADPEGNVGTPVGTGEESTEGTNSEDGSVGNADARENTSNDLTESPDEEKSKFSLDEEHRMGEYLRVLPIEKEEEWTLSVFGEVIGPCLLTKEATLTSDFLQGGEADLWGVKSETDKIRVYARFDALEGLREVYFREELGVLQLDLGISEKDIVIRSVEEDSTAPSDPLPVPEEENESEEEEEENAAPSDPEDQPVPQGSDGGEDPVVDPDEHASSDDGEDTLVVCDLCGATLSETSAHSETCDHYAELPLQSAAYAFLSCLPGLKQDLSVAYLDKENESYCFVLACLSKEGEKALTDAFLSCTVTYDENTESERTLIVRKTLGEKVFTFSVLIKRSGKECRAEINLTGFVV